MPGGTEQVVGGDVFAASDANARHPRGGGGGGRGALDLRAGDPRHEPGPPVRRLFGEARDGDGAGGGFRAPCPAPLQAPLRGQRGADLITYSLVN
eukprot:350717-Prorocentrum_minimum.AAC.1